MAQHTVTQQTLKNTLKRKLGQDKGQRDPGLVTFYDIQLGN